MKIIYIINSLKNGGPVNMLYTLVKNLDADLCDILVVALKDAYVSNTRNFSSLRCKVIVLDGGSVSHSINKVQSIINAEKPDIVHSHGGVADVVNSHLRGTHKCFSTVHCDPDEDFSMKLGKIKGWIKATAFINTLKKIEYPIACSETVSKKILKKRGIQIGYIRNGIDLENLSSLNSKITREKLEIPEDALLMVFCGYLSRRKNVEFICRALMETDRKDVYLMVLGDGDQFEFLKGLSILDNRIKMIGRVSNSYDYLIIADIFVSASLSEGLPLAVMEGMACGLPVLLSDIESHQEIKKCCPDATMLFPIENNEKLTRLISKISKPAKIQIKNATDIVTNYLNAKRMASEYFELYQSKCTNTEGKST